MSGLTKAQRALWAEAAGDVLTDDPRHVGGVKRTLAKRIVKLCDALDAAEARAEKAEALLRTSNAEASQAVNAIVAGVEARADEEARSLMARLEASHEALAALSYGTDPAGGLCWCTQTPHGKHSSPCRLARAAFAMRGDDGARTTADTPDTEKGPEAAAENPYRPEWSTT